MSFRRKTTRFQPRPEPQPAPLLPFGFGSIATQVSPTVSRPRPTQISRVTRATRARPTARPTVTRARARRPSKAERFVRPIRRPEPRPRTARESFVPFQRAFAEETARETRIVSVKKPTQVRRIAKAERVIRPLPERAIRPTVTPPRRDDIEVTTLPTRVVQKPSGRVEDVFAQQIIQVRPPVTGGDILLPSGRIVSAEEQRALKFGDPEAQRQIEREAGGVPFAFQSFVGGARAEFENIGSIVGLGTAREEVGSLAVDLPFAVGAATFTTEAPKGGGFAGLGFDFTFDPARGAEVSGRQQKRIVERFQEDPSRALGSIVTIGTIEAGLFIATGGLGNIAKRGILGVAKGVTTKQQRKFAEKIAGQSDEAIGEKGVPSFLEPIGDGKFQLIRGIDALGERGISVIRGNQAIITRTVGGVEKIKEIKLFKGITETGKKGKIRPTRKLDATELELQRLGLSSDTAVPRAVLGRSSQIPVVIIDTKTRVVRNVAGQRIKIPPRTVAFNREILAREGLNPLSRPDKVILTGVQTKPFQAVRQQFLTGLSPVKGKTLTIAGRPTERQLKTLVALEKRVDIVPEARGITFLTSDVAANPAAFFKLAKTQKSLPREALTATELRTGRIGRISSLEEVTRVGERPLDVPTFEIFSTKTLSPRAGIPFVEKASREGIDVDDFFKGLVKTSKSPKRTKPTKDPTFQEAEKAFDTFAKEQGGAGQRAVQIPKAPPPRPTQLRAVFEAFPVEAPRRVRPLRVPVSTRIAVAGVIPAERARQRPRDDLSFIQDIRLGTGQRITQAQDQIFDPLAGQRQQAIFEPPRPAQTPFFPQDVGVTQDLRLGLVTTPTVGLGVPVAPPVTIPKTIPASSPLFPPIGGAGLLFPFGEERRRRIRKRRKSKLGARLFDVAEEPFGEVAVGLGFFIEQKGTETIEEAIGTDTDFSFDPITRQERQARARLGITTKRKRKKGFKRRKR